MEAPSIQNSDKMPPPTNQQIINNDEPTTCDNDKENLPSSPPSPKVKKLKRKSSIAVARRMSRASTAAAAGVGLPLADQLSLVPAEGDAQSVARLRQILDICLRTTCRTMEAEEAANCGDFEDEVKNISRSIIDQGTIFCDDKLNTLVTRLKTETPEGNPEEIAIGQQNGVEAYTKKLEEEGVAWRHLLENRNKTMKIEHSNLKEVKKGNIKVEESQFYQLPAHQKSFLRSLPKIEDIVKSTQDFEKQQTILTERMAFKSNQLRHHLQDIDKQLATGARELAAEVQRDNNQDILELLNVNQN